MVRVQSVPCFAAQGTVNRWTRDSRGDPAASLEDHAAVGGRRECSMGVGAVVLEVSIENRGKRKSSR